MFKQLADFARTIRGFLGFAAFVVLALLCLCLFLLKPGSLDIGKLSPDQSYHLVIYGLCGVMALLVFTLALSFIHQRNSSNSDRGNSADYGSGELPPELSKMPNSLTGGDSAIRTPSPFPTEDKGMEILSTTQEKFMSEEYITKLAAKLQLQQKPGDKLRMQIDDEDLME